MFPGHTNNKLKGSLTFAKIAGSIILAFGLPLATYLGMESVKSRIGRLVAVDYSEKLQVSYTHGALEAIGKKGGKAQSYRFSPVASIPGWGGEVYIKGAASEQSIYAETDQNGASRRVELKAGLLSIVEQAGGLYKVVVVTEEYKTNKGCIALRTTERRGFGGLILSQDIAPRYSDDEISFFKEKLVKARQQVLGEHNFDRRESENKADADRFLAEVLQGKSLEDYIVSWDQIQDQVWNGKNIFYSSRPVVEGNTPIGDVSIFAEADERGRTKDIEYSIRLPGNLSINLNYYNENLTVTLVRYDNEDEVFELEKLNLQGNTDGAMGIVDGGTQYQYNRKFGEIVLKGLAQYDYSISLEENEALIHKLQALRNSFVTNAPVKKGVEYNGPALSGSSSHKVQEMEFPVLLTPYIEEQKKIWAETFAALSLDQLIGPDGINSPPQRTVQKGAPDRVRWDVSSYKNGSEENFSFVVSAIPGERGLVKMVVSDRTIGPNMRATIYVSDTGEVDLTETILHNGSTKISFRTRYNPSAEDPFEQYNSEIYCLSGKKGFSVPVMPGLRTIAEMKTLYAEAMTKARQASTGLKAELRSIQKQQATP